MLVFEKNYIEDYLRSNLFSQLHNFLLSEVDLHNVYNFCFLKNNNDETNKCKTNDENRSHIFFPLLEKLKWTIEKQEGKKSLLPNSDTKDKNKWPVFRGFGKVNMNVQTLDLGSGYPNYKS